MVNGLSAEASKLAHGRSTIAHDGKVAEPVERRAGRTSSTRATSWITQKLKNTRVYDRGKVLLEPDAEADDRSGRGKPYDKLKMPTFYLNDREVDAIVTFVISNRDRLISDKLHDATRRPTQAQRSRARAAADAEVQLRQLPPDRAATCPPCSSTTRPTRSTTKAPPSLRGEGNKIQHDWLFNFLKNVEPLRPLLHATGGDEPDRIRMPSFPITTRRRPRSRRTSPRCRTRNRRTSRSSSTRS